MSYHRAYLLVSHSASPPPRAGVMAGVFSRPHREWIIEAPPQQQHPSHHEAECALHEWTRVHKFNVTRSKDVKNDSGDVKARLFACDHAGRPKTTRKINNSDRKRSMRRSQRIGCPMRIKIAAVDPNETSGLWQIVHTRDGSQVHNHPPSSDVRVHVTHRQRDPRRVQTSNSSVQNVLELQAAAGVSTSRIFATMLLNDEDTLILPKDISNAKAAARSRLLVTKTQVEALIALLEEKGYHYTYDIDHETDRLRYIMWAHPPTTELAKHFMGLLVLDCTYKTNRYNMPLLNAIILTGMKTILPFAQVYMSGEAEPDFVWAFNQLRKLMDLNDVPLPRVVATDRDLACTNATEVVFPESNKMLCRWHIKRNVEAQAKKKIDVKVQGPLAVAKFVAQFEQTLDSGTESEFNQRSAGLRALSEAMGEYLDRYWWPYKTKFVKCWTNNYTHFGCYDTSTVEGQHATMKSWIHNSRGDLFKVFQQIHPRWLSAVSRNSIAAAKDAAQIPVLFRRDDRFSAVVRIISVYALTETNKLWKSAHKIVVHGLERSHCDGVFRRVHGRPCLHDLMQIIESEDRLKLLPEHFDRHWWLPLSPHDTSRTTQRSVGAGPAEARLSSRPDSRILEPFTLRDRRLTRLQRPTHRAGHGVNSTRRDPSSFELVEQHALVRDSPARRMKFQELLSTTEDCIAYEDIAEPDRIALPPRSWGYAGLRSLDE